VFVRQECLYVWEVQEQLEYWPQPLFVSWIQLEIIYARRSCTFWVTCIRLWLHIVLIWFSVFRELTKHAF
jgi:hypothetical protein